MASDLKIEIFAFKLFQTYLYDFEKRENVPDVLEIYGDECARDISYMEACDDLFIRAFYQRSYLFSEVYFLSLTIEDIKEFTTLSEVYDYIIRMCDLDSLFGNLTVFDRVLATTEYALSVCCLIDTEISGLRDVLKYCHIFWAMYFDKFTEEFYKKGGWNKLKIVAKSYDLIADLFKFLGIVRLWGSLKSLKEATINYCKFKRVLHYYEGKNSKRGQKICVSALWVKFRIQHFNSYISIALNYEEYADSYEVHLVLEDLRFCCDPLLYSKIYEEETVNENNQESSLTELANTFEHNLRIYNTFCKEFCDGLYFEKQFKCDNLISREEVGFDLANDVVNIQFDEKITQHMAPSEEMTEKSRCKQNILPDFTMYSQIGESQKFSKIDDNYTSPLYLNECNIEEFNSRNVEGQSEIPVIPQILSTNPKSEQECDRKTVHRSFHNPRDIGSHDKCANSVSEMINTKEKFEVNFYSTKGQTENYKTMNKQSINKVTASKCDEKSSDMFTKPKQLSLVNICEDNGDKMDTIQKARQDLKNEQDNPKIRNFLRLMLVLGGEQGDKSVRLALPSNEKSPVNLQAKSSKKKRSKKKKFSNFV